MDFIIMLPILVFSVIVHECAHGWMAEKCGDSTARWSGRITLNPLPHIDPIGTILFPLMGLLLRTGFIFGWAKPVPVNYYNLRNPKRDMMLVSAAGAISNFGLAYLFAFLFHLGLKFLAYGVLINLVLAVFNLIPVPPLDGSKVLMGLLPPGYAYSYSKLEPYGMLILFALIFLGIFGIIFKLIVFPMITVLLGKGWMFFL